MKYNPDKHHRQTARLKEYDYTSPGAYFITICTHQRECLFGDVMGGKMQLNALGQMVNACWQRSPSHFPNLTLDAFVIMPNHIHGILVLSHPPGRGAALGHNLENSTKDSAPNATPNPHRSEPGATMGHNLENSTKDSAPNATPNPHRSDPSAALGQGALHHTKKQLPNAAPLQPRLISGSVGAIVLNFKSVTTRFRNQIKRSPGGLMWQRNYYDHVIRNEGSWQFIREYIDKNPRSWQEDQLHPANPSKW